MEKDTDHKTQEAPETTLGEKPRSRNAETTKNNPRGKPQKPENCRARRRRESQLTTAAPLESSTLDPPRERSGFLDLQHHEPRTAPVAVV